MFYMVMENFWQFEPALEACNVWLHEKLKLYK